MSFFGLFPTLARVGQGGGAAFVGVLLYVLTLAQMYVLHGLWALRGWTWTLIIYAIGVVGDLIAGNPVGVIVGLIHMVYGKRDYYR